MDEERKKFFYRALCLAGVLYTVFVFGISYFLLEIWIEIFGPAVIVGKDCVVYDEPGTFFYTNPGMQIKWRLGCFALIWLSGAVLWPLLKKVHGLYQHCARMGCCFFYSFLLFILCVFGAAAVSSCRSSFFSDLQKCTTVEDCERLMGAPLSRRTVGPDDGKAIAALACFGHSGFAPGRELVVFSRGTIPRVFVLVWIENGKIVHVDWCHKTGNLRH